MSINGLTIILPTAIAMVILNSFATSRAASFVGMFDADGETWFTLMAMPPVLRQLLPGTENRHRLVHLALSMQSRAKMLSLDALCAPAPTGDGHRQQGRSPLALVSLLNALLKHDQGPSLHGPFPEWHRTRLLRVTWLPLMAACMRMQRVPTMLMTVLTPVMGTHIDLQPTSVDAFLAVLWKMMARYSQLMTRHHRQIVAERSPLSLDWCMSLENNGQNANDFRHVWRDCSAYFVALCSIAEHAGLDQGRCLLYRLLARANN
jgi:hypothetical protein